MWLMSGSRSIDPARNRQIDTSQQLVCHRAAKPMQRCKGQLYTAFSFLIRHHIEKICLVLNSIPLPICPLLPSFVYSNLERFHL